jgi:hypothetical protein
MRLPLHVFVGEIDGEFYVDAATTDRPASGDKKVR